MLYDSEPEMRMRRWEVGRSQRCFLAKPNFASFPNFLALATNTPLICLRKVHWDHVV